MAHVNIIKQIKEDGRWKNFALDHDSRGYIKWSSAGGRYLIEWREKGKRKRQAAGVTPAEALEAQRRKRLELDAKKSGIQLLGLNDDEYKLPLAETIKSFLADVKAFRKPLTHQKYEYVLQLFQESVVPKEDAREITAEDIKAFLAWRKAKGFDAGTTLYTDRVILHNFFSKLKIDNPVKEVPRLPRFRKRPSAYIEDELKKFFGACDDWERVFFSLAIATGLRRGELQTLHWSDLDLARGQVHVTAKPEYSFLPKDWEERTVPIPRQVASLLRKHPRLPDCSLVFPSPTGHLNYHLHDACKGVAKRAGLKPEQWHLHKFRDTAATRWLRAGVDVRTVQSWLGHESLDTTQKYLEPSKETEAKLNRLSLPF